MSTNVLNIVKQSDQGLTRQQLLDRCCEEGVTDLLPQTRNLVQKGKVRVDKSEKPPKIKATPSAWEQ